MTAVEEAPVQGRFILSVKEKLGDTVLKLVRGDVFRFLAKPRDNYDMVFADPPYNHPRFGEIPELIMRSGVVKPGGLVIVEHSGSFDFSSMPEFVERRSYGSVNFSFFRTAVGSAGEDNEHKETQR